MSLLMQTSQTPRAAAALTRYILEGIDVREALPLVHAPTLVLNNNNPLIPIAHGRYLADHIPNARFVEIAGNGTQLLWDPKAMTEAAAFLTGSRADVEIDRILTTVLFTDIVGSTARVSEIGDERWLALRDEHNKVVRGELRKFRGREMGTTGDGFMASFDGPARAIRCARSIIDSTKDLGIELRAGMHTGECLVRGNELSGLAVHIAARVGDLADAGEVLVSRTVVDLVAGSDVRFSDRGEHELKGVAESWRLFAVAS
jgi:class 3 adenylate cyclase